MSWIDVTSNGKQGKVNLVRNITMDGTGDVVARMRNLDSDGFVGLGICELLVPIGAGNKAEPNAERSKVHTALFFNNVKSVDAWIGWLEEVKLALTAGGLVGGTKAENDSPSV